MLFALNDWNTYFKANILHALIQWIVTNIFFYYVVRIEQHPLYYLRMLAFKRNSVFGLERTRTNNVIRTQPLKSIPPHPNARACDKEFAHKGFTWFLRKQANWIHKSTRGDLNPTFKFVKCLKALDVIAVLRNYYQLIIGWKQCNLDGWDVHL